MVNLAGLPTIFSRENVGRVQHGITSNFQQGEVDFGNDA